jgi:cytochrome c553
MTRSLVNALADAVLGAGLVMVLGAGTAFAAETTAATKEAQLTAPRGDAAKGQVLAGQACAACHGADGNSAIPANPVLAGQHAGYIAKQLANFKSGARKNAIMMGFASGLSPEDMLNLGAWFSQQKAKPRAAADKDLAAAGQKIYRAGNAAVGLPACAGCHSPTGAGIPAQYPRLAGQHAEYTITQLKAFHAGERGNDANKVMRTIASRLSEREMQAVAEYTAGLTGQR